MSNIGLLHIFGQPKVVLTINRQVYPSKQSPDQELTSAVAVPCVVVSIRPTAKTYLYILFCGFLRQNPTSMSFKRVYCVVKGIACDHLLVHGGFVLLCVGFFLEAPNLCFWEVHNTRYVFV